MHGDMDFERLIDEHYASLYRFAISLCANESDACDLVQETFHLWASKGHQLADPSKVKSWLFTTLYRRFLGGRRHLLRFPHQDLEEAAEQLPGSPPQLNSLDWPVLLQNLARLDATFKAPITLFYLEDYSYDDIAKILEVPLGTVKSRISRGIAALQRMFEPSPPGHATGGSPT